VTKDQLFNCTKIVFLFVFALMISTTMICAQDHSGHKHSGQGHSGHDHSGHSHGTKAPGKHVTPKKVGSHAGHNHGADGHDHGSHSKDAHAHGDHDPNKNFNVNEMIMHHIMDSHEFHIAGDMAIPLPVILYVPGEGLKTFLSSKFEHGHKEVDGFAMHHGKVVSTKGYESADLFNLIGGSDNKLYYDFSITKNVFTMMLGALIMFLLFMMVARGYKNRAGKSPKGLQAVMEPLFVFIQDEVAKPNIPHKWQKYLPFLMTLFFFILICNLLGLIPFFPGSGNVSGNIAFTFVLAFIASMVVNFSANKHFWAHTLWMPGVPVAIKPILGVIDFIGVIIIKPASLMIRLFANISGGHIIILSLISLIFIFGQMGESIPGVAVGSIVSTVFVLFMNCIELFVAFLQAFIFTILTALYIGQAVEEPEHH